jgi:hypothetical protein
MNQIKNIIKKELWCLNNIKYNLKEIKPNFFELTTYIDPNIHIIIKLNKGLKSITSNYKIEISYGKEKIKNKKNFIDNCELINKSDKLFHSWNTNSLESLENVYKYIISKLGIKRHNRIFFVSYHFDREPITEIPFYSTIHINQIGFKFNINDNTYLKISEGIKTKLIYMTLYTDNKKVNNTFFEYNILTNECSPAKGYGSRSKHPDELINFCLKSYNLKKISDHSFLIDEDSIGNNPINKFNLLAISFANENIELINNSLPIINKEVINRKNEISQLRSNLQEMQEIIKNNKISNNLKGFMVENIVRCKEILINKENDFKEIENTYLLESSKKVTEKLKEISKIKKVS